MADHSDYDFIGNYDHEKKAGLLHVADHHVSPGKKQWTWGNGDFGQAWDRNLTDEDGPYIELMTGMFTDNQPDFTFLKPYEEKTFTQYFLPYKGIGAVKNANTKVAINLEQTLDGVKILVYGMEKDETVTITLTEGKEVLFQEKTVISPVKFYEKEVALKDCCMEKMELTVTTSDGDSLSYQKEEEQEISIPKPAEALPKPECVQTNEKLFLAALHLEQYRHATYSPADYYLEALKRDPSDLRCNNGYGKYLYGRGYFEESAKYFRQAVQTATWKNPNPYDCEPYYNLGLALLACGQENEAFDAFYKATWDGAMQDKAFYKLACINELGSAMYYNDQPVEMRYYAALAKRKLGKEKEAQQMFEAFLTYGRAHENDSVEIDYFAVSLPDFLVFEGDLSKKNRIHCLKMQALGALGQGQPQEAEKRYQEIAKLQADFQNQVTM